MTIKSIVTYMMPNRPFDAMIYCDTKEQAEDSKYITNKLIESVTLNRVNADKPSVILFTGKSGEGKTNSALRVATEILAMQGINIVDYLNDILVYTPFEYADKVEKILTDERLKKINVFIIDEARGVVKATNWNSFINQAIADINAVSRGVKPLVIIIVSQTVGDIDKATRKTINYEFMCSRPLEGKVRVRPVAYYEYRARGGVEKTELRYRDLRVMVKSPMNVEVISPPVLIFNKANKEVWDMYKSEEKERKTKLIRNRTAKMIEKLKKEWNTEDSKIDTVFEALINNPEKLSELTIVKHGKRYLNENDLVFNDWNKGDLKELTNKIRKYTFAGGVLNE